MHGAASLENRHPPLFLRSAADGGFWDMSGRCAQVSGLRLAFHRKNA
jgi:hypothetical protein